jgi:uncharacterized membrane protein
MSDIATTINSAAESESWRRPAEWLAAKGKGPLGEPARRLERLLGHAAHPALTDLPIGFWTSAWVLDMIGGRRAATAARRLIALGVLSAVPTVLTGLGDVAAMDARRQRIGALHASAAAATTLVYAWSWNLRRRGHRLIGILAGMIGAALATVAGAVGGHLAYAPDPKPDESVEPFVPTADPGLRVTHAG